MIPLCASIDDVPLRHLYRWGRIRVMMLETDRAHRQRDASTAAILRGGRGVG